MKKFMKAIAFVTVMCMALSTVAFAAIEQELAEERVLDITVAGAEDDQVALVVVEEGGALTEPLYIDQKPASNGTVEFRAVLTNKTDVDVVDIYVGYETYALLNSAPEKLASIAITNPVTNVVIEKANATVIPTEDIALGSDQTGAGVYATFNVTAPEGTSAAQMIWAIRYDYIDENGNPASTVKYSDPITLADYGIGNVMTGSVQLALAFLNGSKLYEIDPVSITAVDAIFSFSDGEEILTNPADAANKAN